MKYKLVASLLVAIAFSGLMQMFAQTITTGDLAGTVSDPSGAVVTNGVVELRNLEEGSVNTAKTSSSGYYHFAYLKPGNYKVTAAASGFETSEKTVNVALGAGVSANFTLTLGAATTTVEVTGAASEIETEDANLTANFSSKQLDLLPNPGDDLARRGDEYRRWRDVRRRQLRSLWIARHFESLYPRRFKRQRPVLQRE
jgi:hypothetical protein